MTWTATRTAALATTALLASGLLAACGNSPTAASSPATPGSTASSTVVAAGPTATATATPTTPVTAEEPAFPADTAADTGTASADAALTVSDVTVGAHDGYDRVVLTLGGTGTPGWRVEYVDSAVDDPSGQSLDVAGSAFLQVLVDGSGYPYDTGVTEWTGSPLRPTGLEQVREVNLRGVFEAQTQAVIGLDHTAPFRVFALSDPTRLVIDVQH